MADVTHPFSPGAQFGSYRIESLAGRGGMAFVYKARDLRLDRRVALKVLSPALFESVQGRERFLRESRTAASLDHPNIVPIYEAGEMDGFLYIAMRYVEGHDLKARLARTGPLDLATASAILSQVASALDAAHSSGLVHRDVKPGNILISTSATQGGPPQVYLTDFGITKRAATPSDVTTFGQFVGTMDYAAPEQIARRTVDARVDVYAFGCVAYQCLTGRMPFVRDDEAALLWAHLVEMPDPVSRYRPELAAVDPLFAKVMAKSPDERYSTCGQFAADLAALVPTGTASAGAGPGAGATGAGPRERPPGAGQSMAATVGPGSAPPVVPDLGSWPTVVSGRAGQLDDGTEHGWGGTGARPLDDGAGPGTDGTGAGPRTGGTGAGPKELGGRDVHGGPGRPRRGGWTGRGENAGGRPRSRVALAALLLVAVVMAGFFAVRAITSGSSGPSTTTASALEVCRNALGAADQSFDHAGQVAIALRDHAIVMNRQMKGELTAQQAYALGNPSLRRGAADAALLDRTRRDYNELAGECRSADVSGVQDCKEAISAADRTLGYAGSVQSALRDHTSVMDRLDSGELTSEQAHAQGMSSLAKGAADSAQFDKALPTYNEAASMCR